MAKLTSGARTSAKAVRLPYAQILALMTFDIIV
jgi:hypothetical protein